MEKSRTIGISEIFYSVQGEGFHSGTPAVFIRTAGCNLTCHFCDTEFSLREKMTSDEIVKEVLKHPAKFIVITGGEPTLQGLPLRNLIMDLKKMGYYISMETNGTSQDTLGVDWITVSPKIKEGGDWVLKKGDELKLVYQEQELKYYEQSEFSHYFLQPMEVRTKPWGKGERDEVRTREEWSKTVQAVIQNPKWKLSFQIHKELNLP